MPRKVAAYLCKFECGRHATTDFVAVQRHEGVCLFNPESRSCETCALQRKVRKKRFCDATGGPDDAGGWLRDPLWLEVWKSQPRHHHATWPPRARWDCPGWKEKA